MWLIFRFTVPAMCGILCFFFRRGQIVNHRKSILVPLFCAPSFRKLFFRWRMPKMQLENHYFPFLGRMGHFFLSEVPYPQGMNLWGSQRAFEKKERRKKIPETNMETAFLKQHPAVSPESKHHCCSTILLKPKFTANDFRRRHVLSVHISDIKPCVQEQKLVRRIHKKTWFQQPQKRTSSPSLPSLACTVCHFETVLDSVWRTVKGLSNAATNGEREKEKRGRNPFEVLLLVCSSSSCVCASIHQIWGSPHLIPLSHSGRFSLSFLSHFIRNFVAATFPDFGRVFCCCPFKIGGAKTLFFSETRKTNIKSGNAARHAIRTELKPPKLNVKRGSNTKIIPREW